MAWACKILKDSVGAHGKRLTTFEVTYPRMIHAELMTHRQLSRNAASSRAIPIDKIVSQVMDDPAMPIWWGKNQKGMQANEELAGRERQYVVEEWLIARDKAVTRAIHMKELGAHKQIVNRVLEPFCWITVIISATEWSNFFALRCHPDAQPEFQHIARMMQAAYQASTPHLLGVGELHLPLVYASDFQEVWGEQAAKVSVGRCARVSYLTHDGRRDLAEDIALCDRLAASGHWSPFEHVASVLPTASPSGNFVGFGQFRKQYPGECR